VGYRKERAIAMRLKGQEVVAGALDLAPTRVFKCSSSTVYRCKQNPADLCQAFTCGGSRDRTFDNLFKSALDFRPREPAQELRCQGIHLRWTRGTKHFIWSLEVHLESGPAGPLQDGYFLSHCWSCSQAGQETVLPPLGCSPGERLNHS
jgi:hypothetical protein